MVTWLSGYAYRAKIPVNHTDDGAQTNYQMMVALIKGTGANAAGHIHLNDHALDWPEDVRFTKADGTTPLDFWREESDATDGTWWVEVDSIAAHPDTTDIYVYYGKASDSDASDGIATFLFFDDFPGADYDHDKWLNEVGNEVGVSVSGGALTLTGSGGGSWYKFGSKTAAFGQGHTLEYRVTAMSNNIHIQGWNNPGFCSPASSKGVFFYNYNDRAYNNDGTTQTYTALANTRATGIFKIKYRSTSSYYEVPAGTNTTYATNMPSGDIHIAWWETSTNSTSIDWVRVREDTANEPTWATPGLEQTTITLAKNSDSRFLKTTTLSNNSNAIFFKAGNVLPFNSNSRFFKASNILSNTSNATFTLDTHLDQDGWEWHYNVNAPTVLTRVVRIGTASTEVNIPEHLSGTTDILGIALGCFSDTEGKKVTKVLSMPNTVTSIGESAFESCTALTSVTMGSGLTSIGNDAFRSCTSLTSVIIPNSVTSIGERAFRSCTSLASVTIGSGVTSIGGVEAFVYCPSLTTITVDADNANFASINGVLYNKAITTAIQFPIANAATVFIVPNSVTSIGQDAFYQCIHLTTLTLGDGVTSIGWAAFYGCSALTSIRFLSHDVPTVGQNWILNTNAGILGHAYSTSHFPVAPNYFPAAEPDAVDRLTMGVTIDVILSNNSDARFFKASNTISNNSNVRFRKTIPLSNTSDATFQLALTTTTLPFDSNARFKNTPDPIINNSNARFKNTPTPIANDSNAKFMRYPVLPFNSDSRFFKVTTLPFDSNARMFKASNTFNLNSSARFKNTPTPLPNNSNARFKREAVIISNTSNALFILELNLKARYDMETIYDTKLKDLSGYGNHGTLEGGITVGGVAGIEASATAFDGSNDVIDIGNGASITNIATNRLTLIAWVKPDTLRTSLSTIVDSKDAATTPYALYATSDGRVAVMLKLGGTQYLKVFGAVGDVPIGAWTMVAFTFDGTDWTVYINKVAQTPQTQAGTLDTTTGNVVLGGRFA